MAVGGALVEGFDQHAAVAQDDPLRRKVVRIGGDFHGGQASLPRPSGLRPSSQHVSGGPDAGAAEIGCVWALQGRGLRPRRPGKPEGKRYERHPLGLRSVFNGLVPRPTTTRVRVRELGKGCSGGCSGRKKAFEKPIPAQCAARAGRSWTSPAFAVPCSAGSRVDVEVEEVSDEACPPECLGYLGRAAGAVA